jgi:hypothetical protein
MHLATTNFFPEASFFADLPQCPDYQNLRDETSRKRLRDGRICHRWTAHHLTLVGAIRPRYASVSILRRCSRVESTFARIPDRKYHRVKISSNGYAFAATVLPLQTCSPRRTQLYCETIKRWSGRVFGSAVFVPHEHVPANRDFSCNRHHLV